MAGTLSLSPTYGLTPTAQRVPTSTNYIKDFNFLNQYLPEQYQKEFERYGNRSVASFLRMLSAEIPFASDLIKWSEQGRLHTKYNNVWTTNAAGATSATNITFNCQSGTVCAFRVGQTVFISQNAGTATNKAVITQVSGATFQVAYYEASQAIVAGTSTTNLCTAFVYGSEFQKGKAGMEGSLEAQSSFFENKPIIIKDNYEVSGSDMAQIGWVEVSDETGGSGYLWYLKSSHETRTRFEDYLEMSMVEGKLAETSSGALAHLSPNTQPVTGGGANLQTTAGTKGLFSEIDNRGNVWSGGNPNTLNDFDAVIQRLDKQGAIQENAIFLNRQFSFDIDDMLAAQSASAMGGSSFGLFDNDKDMALNLGFSGFRRGYDFYKTDWKYLNDAQTRGDLVAGAVNGVLVPAGSTNVYDQVLGKNAKRPFLHVRYRKSEVEDRKYKSWVTGGAGGASNSDVDSMKVNFLSERALCVLGANNFFIFKN
jgi:hypothetical protein